MGDSLYDLLAPHFDPLIPSSAPSPIVGGYLSYLTTLSLSALSDSEPRSLAQSSNSNLLSLQALSTRHHRSVITACDAFATLGEHLPTLASSASSLRNGIPELDESALDFARKYSKSSSQNEMLDRRKEAMVLSRNVDRVTDILELPTLLANTIASPFTPAASSASSGSGSSVINYSQSLDLFVHIKRLQILYPDSNIVRCVLAEAEEAMKDMTSNLILSLRGQNVRLAAAIRSVGWLRRVAPELATPGLPQSSAKMTPGVAPTASEGSLGYLFLTCRLYNLLHMLEALIPLRDLAYQETLQRLDRQENSTTQSAANAAASARISAPKFSQSPFTGHQTERYLKRYIEIFREQSFATVSMYKNIFPVTSSFKNPDTSTPTSTPTSQSDSSFLQPPSALSTFSSQLVSLLTETLKAYLPNLSDPSARDSLMMQVLYAAGSLGRLGADFTMLIIPSLFPDEEDDDGDSGSHSELDETEVKLEVEGQDKPDNKNKESDTHPHTTLSRPQTRSPSDDDDMVKEDSTATAVLKEENQTDNTSQIPEHIRLLRKHRLQASRLDALSLSSSTTPIASRP